MQALSVAQKLQVNWEEGTPREEQGREHSELGGPGGDHLWGRASKRKELPRERTPPLPDYPSESLSSTNLSTHKVKFHKAGKEQFLQKEQLLENCTLNNFQSSCMAENPHQPEWRNLLEYMGHSIKTPEIVHIRSGTNHKP